MRDRWLAAAELLLFTFVLVGHYVWRVVPFGEVVPFFFLGWISLRLRGLGWRSVGLVRPASWPRAILLALAIAVGLQLVSLYVTDPLVWRLLHQRQDLSEFRPLVGNLKLALLALALVWTWAAFGEELVYRGYVFNRVVDLAGGGRAAGWLAVAATTVLFGLGHLYQGWAGVLDSGVTGLTLGLVYARTRNLWHTILAHGLTDTLAVLLVFSGQVPGLR